MKKRRNKKKKKLQWLYAALVVIAACVFLSQLRHEREMVRFFEDGNRAYEAGDYTEAQGYYREAVDASRKLLIHRGCDVRRNRALAVVAPLTPDSITEDTLDETIMKLENAVYMLTAEGCADMFDNDGHDRECQTLKNEIEEYIERLRPPEEPEEESEETEEMQAEDEEEKDPDEQLRRELEQIQKDGLMERKNELDTAENLMGSFEFYDGECW